MKWGEFQTVLSCVCGKPIIFKWIDGDAERVNIWRGAELGVCEQKITRVHDDCLIPGVYDVLEWKVLWKKSKLSRSIEMIPNLASSPYFEHFFSKSKQTF